MFSGLSNPGEEHCYGCFAFASGVWIGCRVTADPHVETNIVAREYLNPFDCGQFTCLPGLIDSRPETFK